MTSTVKIACAAMAGCGSVGVIGFGTYRHFNSYTSIEEKLKGTLLSQKGNATEWGARLISLKSYGGNLVPDLKAIKDKSVQSTTSDLQNWCSSSVKNKFDKESDLLFQNTQKYCTYSIKEKLGKGSTVEDGTQDGDTKLSGLFSKLSGMEESKLSSFFKDIKNTQNTNNNEGNKALKAKCKAIYEHPFKGEDDLEFNNAKELCILPD